MFKVITVLRRPDTLTPFFHELHSPSDEWSRVYYKKYVVTGKSLNFKSSLSEDQLTATFINEWNTRQSFLDFISDTNVHLCEQFEKMHRYNEDHGFIEDISFDEFDKRDFYNLAHIFIVFRPGSAGNFISNIINNLKDKTLKKIITSLTGHAHYNSIAERKKLGIDYLAMGMGIDGVDKKFFTEDDKIEYFKSKIDVANYEHKIHVTWTHDFANIPLYKKTFPNSRILVVTDDTVYERLVALAMAINKNYFSKDGQLPVPFKDLLKPEISKKALIAKTFSKIYPGKSYSSGYEDVDRYVMYHAHLKCHKLEETLNLDLGTIIPHLDSNSDSDLSYFERRSQHSIGYKFSTEANYFLKLSDILFKNYQPIVDVIEKLLDQKLTDDDVVYLKESIDEYVLSQDIELLQNPIGYLTEAKKKADTIVSAFEYKLS